MKSVLIAASIAAATLASGCASLTNNTAQPVIVRTTCGDVTVRGAQCAIQNTHGSWVVQSTPGVAMIAKSPSDMAVSCNMPGVQGDPILYESHATLGAWGNAITLGPIGFGFDAFKDAAWGYHPEMTVDICHGQSDGTIKRIQSAAADNGSPGFAVTRDNTPDLAGMRSTLPARELRYSIAAESVAKERQCTAKPIPVLSARGPATEVYTVGCDGGEALMLKCTWGTCTSI